jgi:hypothetical protein
MGQAVLSRLAFVILSLAFCYACFNSWKKFRAKEMGVVLDQINVKVFEYPTIMVCPGSGDEEVDSFEKVFNQKSKINMSQILQHNS